MKSFSCSISGIIIFHKTFNYLIIITLFICLLSTPIQGQSQINLDDGNYALQFDGINDEVYVGFNSILDIVGDITICAWYKTNSQSWGALVCNYDQYYPDNGYELTSSSGYDEGGFVYFECAYNDARDGFSTNNSFNDGKWHFVSAVYTPDGSSEGKVYIDGIKQSGYYWGGSERLPAIGATPDYVFKMGAAYSEAYFEGAIDEVRIWNVARTQEEIQAKMYTHLNGTEEGLVGYWPFNEGSGNVVNDLSGNNNHGTIHGPTWVGSGAPIGTVIIFCNPNYGYRDHNLFTTIQGANTHFAYGTEKVWLSKDDQTIPADHYTVNSNTLIDARFYIPADAASGQWDINVDTVTDSTITMPVGIEVLPPPSVTCQTSSTSSWLRSVYALNDQTCWAVGNDGSIQKTTDGGLTWESQSSGTSNVLYSTYFTDEITGWAVGQYGSILHTTNGGEEWNSQNSGTSNNLQSVCFVDVSTGWVVGRLGTVLKTTDGGAHWESQSSGTTAWLYSVCFATVNDGWAVGSNGTILNTSNGGQSWEAQISGTTDYLSSVHFCDSDTGWTAGNGGTIFKTTDGGLNWMAVNTRTTEWLRSVSFRDARTGWAVGSNGTILMTEDGGESWSARKSFTDHTLNAVYYRDDNIGWAVGEAGTILKMTMYDLLTEIEDNARASSLPHKFELYQNYPNPFNPITNIEFSIQEIKFVTLKVYNILGQEIATLVSDRLAPGHYKYALNASGFASGVYYYKMATDQFQQVKKMIVLK
jgi:photosystem II stability/assembly factor-like uncharacterized protein